LKDFLFYALRAAVLPDECRQLIWAISMPAAPGDLTVHPVEVPETF